MPGAFVDLKLAKLVLLQQVKINVPKENCIEKHFHPQRTTVRNSDLMANDSEEATCSAIWFWPSWWNIKPMLGELFREIRRPTDNQPPSIDCCDGMAELAAVWRMVRGWRTSARKEGKRARKKRRRGGRDWPRKSNFRMNLRFRL